jgi:hypothetical protein
VTPEQTAAELLHVWDDMTDRGPQQLKQMIATAIRAAENDALERVAALIGRKSLAGVISMSDAMDACRCLKHREPVSS